MVSHVVAVVVVVVVLVYAVERFRVALEVVDVSRPG